MQVNKEKADIEAVLREHPEAIPRVIALLMFELKLALRTKEHSDFLEIHVTPLQLLKASQDNG